MIMDNHPFLVNKKGHLEIDGVDSLDLAKKYGTPLYVYDVSLIRKNCRAFINTFKKMGVSAKVSYASKAFSSVAMLQVMEQEDMHLDVVSGGELYTALQANFPADRIHMHGKFAWSAVRSEEHTSELQSRGHLVCRLLLAKKKI